VFRVLLGLPVWQPRFDIYISLIDGTPDREPPAAIAAQLAVGNCFTIGTHELTLIGAEVVLKLTARAVEEETFFDRLAEMGILPEISARDSGKPLVFSGRQLASAALRSMHSMSIVNEWQAPHFCGYAATPWWRVPSEDGIVVCGLFWDVLLIDYGAVKSHNGAILDDRGWDCDYIMLTIGDLETILCGSRLGRNQCYRLLF
jgi:hypothetical protein